MEGVVSAERRARGAVGRPGWWLWALLLAPVLLVPAVWNGGPFVFFFDTVTYIRRPADIVGEGFEARLFPPRSTAVPRPAGPPMAAGGERTPDVAAERAPRRWMAGRSIWYGLPAALLWGGVSVWAVLLVQALVVTAALAILWFPGLGLGAAGFAAAVALIALGSTAGIFAGLVMPDVLTGVAVLAAGGLILFERRLDRAAAFILLGLAAWAGASHDTHLPLLAGLAAVGALLAALGAARWRGAALVGAALGLALLGSLAFHLASLRATGEPPLRYPFLAARVVASPPGLEALERRCPQAGLLLCDFRERIGTAENSWVKLLFSVEPDKAVWMALDAQGQQRLASEQGAVVRLVASDAPFDLALLLVSDWARQLARHSLYPLASPTDVENFAVVGLTAQNTPARGFGAWFATRQAAGWKAEVARLDRWFAFVALVSVAAGALLWRRASTDARLVALLILLGWLGHAVIVATLARPYDRFGARVLWLVPAAMAVVAGSALARPRAAYPRRTIS